MPDEVQSMMMEAEASQLQKDWDEAIRKYQAVMEMDPINEEACSKLAELFAVRGQISNVVDTYFNLMDILEQKEEFELAVEVARWIMKLQPENDKSRMKIILIYKKKGDMDEVVKQSLQLARLYIELGQGDQSILLLKNAQEISPDNLDIGLELAEMYISHGHIPEGTAQYKKIANAHLEKGNHEKAAESFRRMKVVQPDDPQLLFTLGNLYMSLNKLNEAEAEFRAILRHNLNHTDALMALGNVCQKKGQFRDAILAFNKILSINPADEIAKEKLGELYQAQGATSEAVKFYLQAANTYQYGNAVDRAIKLYQRVLTIDPTNPTACRELTNLGAPLQEDMEEEALKDAYAPVISPLEVDETELDMVSGPSLEEMASAILPPSISVSPERLAEEKKSRSREDRKPLRKETEEKREAPPVTGAVPSAFSTREEEKEEPLKFKAGIGSDIEFSGRDDDSDLYMAEEEEEESEDSEEESTIARKSRKSKKGALKKKDKFEKKSQKGLVKKGVFKSEDDKKADKSGLLTNRGKAPAPKKEILTKKTPVKGLFSRRGLKSKDGEYDEELLAQEQEMMQEEMVQPEETAMPEAEYETAPAYDESMDNEILAEEYPEQSDYDLEAAALEEESPLYEEQAEYPEPQADFESEPGLEPEPIVEPEPLYPEAEEFPLYAEDEPQPLYEEAEALMPEEAEVPLLPEEMLQPLEEEEVQEAVVEETVAAGSSLLGKKKKSLKDALKGGKPEPGMKKKTFGKQPLVKAALTGKLELPPLMEEEPVSVPEAEEMPEIEAMPFMEEEEAYTAEPLVEDEFPMAEMPLLEEEYEYPLEIPQDEEIPEPISASMSEDAGLEEESFPEFTEDAELPELDLSESEFGEMEEIPEPLSDELHDLPQVPEAFIPPEEAPVPAEIMIPSFPETSGELEQKDRTDDFDFDLSALPSFDAEPTKHLDFDDFTASLLKLADEIEQIIPDEERIREAEEQKKMEDSIELEIPAPAVTAPLQLPDEEAEQEAEAPKVTAAPTAFLELPVNFAGEEDFSIESLPQVPGEEMIPEVTAAFIPAETVLLPPLEEIMEITPPPQIVEEFEALPQMEIEEEEIVVEIIEEEAPPPPEIDITEKIRDLIEQGDIGQVLPLFVEAVEKKPEDVDLLKSYAEVSYNYGLLDNAIDSLKVLIQKEPANHDFRKQLIRGQLLANINGDAVTSLLEYGNILTAEDKVEEALRIYQHALALRKENSFAREALSEIYLNLDMKELALYHLNILAQYLEQQNNIDEAIKILKKIFALTTGAKIQEKLSELYIEHNYVKEAVVELMSIAESCIQKNDNTKAAIKLEKVVEMEPGNLEAHILLIGLYDKLNNKEKCYQEKVLVANLYLEQGNLDESRKRFEECLSIRNQDQDVRRKLVDIYLKQNNLQRALEESRILGEVFHKARNYAEAIALFLELLDHDPKNVGLRDKLSEFYVMSDQLDKGLGQLILVAEEMIERKEWDGAIKAYKKALSIDAKNADIHFRIGEIFLNQKKNVTEARYEFAKVFELDPTHRKAMEYLVNLYLEEEKPSQAIQVLTKLTDLDQSYLLLQNKIISGYQEKTKANTEDMKAHFFLGIIYKELQMWTKAIEQFQTTRKSKEYVLESQAMLGACFSQQPPMLSLAVKTLEKGLETPGFKPKDYIDLHYQLGVIHMNSRKYDKALGEFQAVVALDSHYKDTAELLKDVKAKIK